MRLLLEAAAAPDGPDGPPHGGPPRSTGAAVWFAAEAGHAEVPGGENESGAGWGVAAARFESVDM